MQNLTNEKDLISVIIPVYNVRSYLEQAIESVIHQTFPFLEIILIDDGSTDGSGEICDRFAKAEHRIKVIHQKNQGLSAARNVGLNICKGKMVAFLDPDDVFCRNALSKMYDTMQRTGAEIVECNYAIYNDHGILDSGKIHKKQLAIMNKNRKKGVFNNQDALRMQLDGLMTSTVWNKLYQRKVWENIRFREGHNYEDVDIILPLLEKSRKVCIINDVLLMYRKRQGSITTTHSYRNFSDRFAAHRHYIEFIQSHIPEYFHDYHIKMVNENFYAKLLKEYFRNTFYRLPDRMVYFSLLKKGIIIAQKKVDLKDCSRTVRALSWLFENTPHVIAGMIYWAYLPLRVIIKKVYFCWATSFK